MANKEFSPNQIFSVSEIPTAWKDAYQANFASMPTEIKSQLEAAWKFADDIGFPERKDENWRWMDLKALDLESLHLDSSNSPLELTINYYKDPEAEVAESSELPKGLLVTTLQKLLETDRELALRLLKADSLVNDGVFAALSYALASDGLVVYVPRGLMIEGLVQAQIKLSLEKQACFSRNIVYLEEASSLSLEIVWVNEESAASGLHDGVLDVRLGDRSNLHLDERQELDLSKWNITHEVAALGVDAQLEWNYAAVGSVLSKNFIKVELEGKGSNAKLNGAMFPTKEQLINLDTRQNHWEQSTVSDLVYKSVASLDGRSIWHGMIYVDPKAQGTDAYQTNNNLILDDSADVKTLPGLEIHADDVKCSHGATVGKIDEEELFYLGSRGIAAKDAEKLIVEGFFYQVLRSFKLERSRVEVLNRLLKRMDF